MGVPLLSDDGNAVRFICRRPKKEVGFFFLAVGLVTDVCCWCSDVWTHAHALLQSSRLTDLSRAAASNKALDE